MVSPKLGKMRRLAFAMAACEALEKFGAARPWSVQGPSSPAGTGSKTYKRLNLGRVRQRRATILGFGVQFVSCLIQFCVCLPDRPHQQLVFGRRVCCLLGRHLVLVEPQKDRVPATEPVLPPPTSKGNG